MVFKNANLFETGESIDKPLSVADYIELLNVSFARDKVKIVGEVSQVKIASSGHVYFSLKDEKQNAVLECVMWRYAYQIAGIALEVGLFVAVSGSPGVYPPTGRFSFKCESVELVGEGALKKAYDELKMKLDREGLFAPERKRPIPAFAHRIGVITSKHGAVIHDFLNNLGKFGFHITMIDSRVEGAQSVTDLIASIRAMRRQPIDALVIIRGGGSLESLIGFNNEALVREIAAFPVPVCAGIGHDQDVPLAALVADVVCSTPTAVANLLGSSWRDAQLSVVKAHQVIFGSFERTLATDRRALDRYAVTIPQILGEIITRYRNLESLARMSTAKIARTLALIHAAIAAHRRTILSGVAAMITRRAEQLSQSGRIIAAHDPRRQLALGYSIARSKGKVLRSIAHAHPGERIEIVIADGTIDTTVINIEESNDLL